MIPKRLKLSESISDTLQNAGFSNEVAQVVSGPAKNIIEGSPVSGDISGLSGLAHHAAGTFRLHAQCKKHDAENLKGNHSDLII